MCYRLFIVMFALPVPTTGEVALLDNSITSGSYFSYDSRTFACSASHVFLASPRSMDVLGLQKIGLSTAAQPTPKDLFITMTQEPKRKAESAFNRPDQEVLGTQTRPCPNAEQALWDFSNTQGVFLTHTYIVLTLIFLMGPYIYTHERKSHVSNSSSLNEKIVSDFLLSAFLHKDYAWYLLFRKISIFL